MAFATAIAAGSWAAAIKLLDGAMPSASSPAANGVASSSATVVPLLVNRALCNLKLQLFRKALKDCDEALAVQPSSAEALHRKGQVLAALKRLPEAVAAWQQALQCALPSTDARLILELTALIKDPSQDTTVAPVAATPSTGPQAAATQNGVKAATTPASSASPVAPHTPTPSHGGSASGRKASSQEEVVDLDCAASQEQKGKARAAPLPQPPLNTSIAIQLAVTQINSGKVAEALQILDSVVAGSPRELGALVARGTARALKRDLKGAIEDFSAAIEIEPRYADTWKRRGQSLSALGGRDDEALQDLSKAMQLLPLLGQDSPTSRAECLLERAMIYQRRRDFRRACVELREGVKLEPKNHQMWNILGLCATSQGDIRQGVAAYEQAVKLKPDLKEAWLNMAQALKEEGKTSEADRAFHKALALDSPDAPSMVAYRVMAQMRQQKGQHQDAIDLINKAVALKRDDHMVELLYLRAICYHALGYVREAVRDYEECLAWSKGTLSEEACGFQYLSFYQKEMALYLFHNLNRRFADMCLDAEFTPLFKELWCKKGAPTAEMIGSYCAQQPLPASPPPPPPRGDTAKLALLTTLADRCGKLLQNQHQGFLPNVRQQRAAGLAALELAQSVTQLLAARRAGKTVWVASEGSSAQGGASGRHQFGWRDAMDVVVKWRQLSEPNDQVVWVDLLTRREFEQGFGSHTPMFTGQTKCVRYYMNFKRAFELFKEVLLRKGHAFDASNRPIPCGSNAQRDAIKAATTAQDMYEILRQDCWVIVHIDSLQQPNKKREGTRLTLVRVPNQPDAFEFSIRTPVTPPRWAEFDTELEAGWEAVISSMLQEDKVASARCILHYAYYWYNFMPLARGTAACGYTTIMALFWAAGMPVTTPIPKDYQVDWEAILAQQPQQFVSSVSQWLYPPAAKGDDTAAPSQEFPDVSTLPTVGEQLSTLRQRIEILNGEGARRL